MVMATLTPLCARNEIYHWDNRPFISSWPEPTRKKVSQGAEIKRTIKKKPKRTRTSFTTEQLKYLEDTFANQSYINTDERLNLAKAMKIGEKQIKVWFQNRRMKEKRRSTEMSETYSEISSSPSPTSYYRKEPEYSFEKNDVNNTFFEVPIEIPIEIYNHSTAQVNQGDANVSDYELPLPTFNILDTNNGAFVDFFDAQYANCYNNAIYNNSNVENMNADNLHGDTANYNYAHFNGYYNSGLQNNGYVYNFTAWQ